MFSKEGYTSLANLWNEFERQNLGWCHRRACTYFQSHGFTNDDVFGSPLDLCEDIFISSMTEYELALLTPSEQVIRSPAKLPNSNASLFTKATVFESMAIAHDPHEAGLDNEWLSQMGSTRFDDWTHTEADFSTWGDKYCSDGQVTDRSTMRFYTLPYCFERATFVVPKELPPWTRDMIDPSFARNLSGPLLGSSICLNHTSAGRWRRKLSKEYLERLFAGAMSAIDDVEMNKGGPKAGRPKKVSAVASAYVELGLDRSDLSWKEKHALVREHLGMAFGMTTLKSAAELAASGKNTKT